MSQLPFITNVDQLEEWIEASDQQPVLLFKHSTRCNISADALEELKKYQEEFGSDSKVAIIDVIEGRPVSNAIAERFGIKHESPQAIWIKDRKAVWHASHWHITHEALKDAHPDKA